jgi:major membrane immunogen (membrane-anchored lipoprotein)
MKKSKIPFAIVFIVMLFVAYAFCSGQDIKVTEKKVQDTTGNYPDGIYFGQSRHTYTDEPYWGNVHITVNNGVITGINFMIRDSNLHETFNENYEKHFLGNPVYIQQCKNDWNGVQTYPKKLIEIQDTNKIDAMSGATWSYNIFRASTKEAFKNAKKQPE